MVHQQGIQGAIEHYTHPERVAWQSMCATDEGMLKGEQWCKMHLGKPSSRMETRLRKCGKHPSGDFVSLWTGRIDHLANRYSAASSGVAVNPNPKINTRSATLARSEPRGPWHRVAEVRAKAAKTIAGRAQPTLARSERRAPQPNAAEVRAKAAKTTARRARPLSAVAESSNDGNRTARSSIKPRRAISGSPPVQKRLQKQAAVIPR